VKALLQIPSKGDHLNSWPECWARLGTWSRAVCKSRAFWDPNWWQSACTASNSLDL